MKITVEGLLTSVAPHEKDGKKSTELFLAQQGEREQVKVRVEGDLVKTYTEKMLTTQKFTGRLMTWNQRNGVGSMVIAE